jgi:hypothetical protein
LKGRKNFQGILGRTGIMQLENSAKDFITAKEISILKNNKIAGQS